jgi:hypothetical protein
MRRYRLISTVVVSAVALFGVALLPAQSFSTRGCEGGGSSSGFLGHLFSQESACEVRSTTIPLAGGHLRLSNFNGSVEVTGEDRADVALEARVEAHAHSRAGAESMLREIRVFTDGTIVAKGPRADNPQPWSVSYRLRVPRRLTADIVTSNGSMKLASLEGEIQARTTNGALSLSELAGDVHASTTNGGVAVELGGATWRGGGLWVRSTNGGIQVKIARSYSAHLVAKTTNGEVSSNFFDRPEARRHNSLDATVGQGGPTLDFGTTNGGISFSGN